MPSTPPRATWWKFRCPHAVPPRCSSPSRGGKLSRERPAARWSSKLRPCLPTSETTRLALEFRSIAGPAGSIPRRAAPFSRLFVGLTFFGASAGQADDTVFFPNPPPGSACAPAPAASHAALHRNSAAKRLSESRRGLERYDLHTRRLARPDIRGLFRRRHPSSTRILTMLSSWVDNG